MIGLRSSLNRASARIGRRLSVAVMAVVLACASLCGHAWAESGTAWSWGNNNNSTLGDGTTTSRYSPGKVVGPAGDGFLADIVAVSAGGYHSMALKSDGTVWTWGLNGDGRLGDGTTTSRQTPVQVVLAGGQAYLTSVAAVAAGVDHSVALRVDGTVWTWGAGQFGQLGHGAMAEIGRAHVRTPVT